MYKLARIFIVQRSGLEHHWWHRLANVLIYASAIVVATIIAGLIISDSSSWKKNIYTYSFESNYETAKGVESNCSFTANDIGIYDFPSIDCGGNLYLPSSFIKRYAASEKDFKSIIAALLNQGLLHPSETNISDGKTINALIRGKYLENISLKNDVQILFGKLIKQILLGLFVTFVWFVFLESIIYRAFIYIVLGRGESE